MINYKAYAELECDNLDTISHKIYKFLQDKTTILADQQYGWIFLDVKSLLTSVPELLDFFKKQKLVVKDAAITLIVNDFPVHIDPLPVVAKINIPVINVDGWVNQWYEIDPDSLKKCPIITTEFGHTKEDVSVLPADAFKLIAEYEGMKKVIVFHSRMAHGVKKVNPTQLPRIISSFTFYNEPLHLLK
jgi:hypothetical protein